MFGKTTGKTSLILRLRLQKIDNLSLTSFPIYAIPHATGLASKHAKRFMEEKNGVKHNSKTYIVDAVKLILNK